MRVFVPETMLEDAQNVLNADICDDEDDKYEDEDDKYEDENEEYEEA